MLLGEELQKTQVGVEADAQRRPALDGQTQHTRFAVAKDLLGQLPVRVGDLVSFGSVEVVFSASSRGDELTAWG